MQQYMQLCMCDKTMQHPTFASQTAAEWSLGYRMDDVVNVVGLLWQMQHL